MTREAYCNEVRSVLESLHGEACQQIAACFSQIPEEAIVASFNLFADQDGEGFLDILISLDGPDLSQLQHAIAEHFQIVSTTIAEDGLQPPFPLMDPFEDLGFSVQDALIDEAATWILSLWASNPPDGVTIPVFVTCPEGDGTILPMRLA